VEEVAVQGPYASEEIIGALQRLDADPAVDVIIIARGGGSVEDLLPFSDEDLVRAVAACVTPVISAIGHEQDVPLLDLVADVRASTPTDAARRAVPDVAEQLEVIKQLRSRARRSVAGRLDREAAWLAAITSRPALASPMREIDRQHEQILGMSERGRLAIAGGLSRAADDLVHIKARLIALSPAATLRRGYAIVQHDDGSVVPAASEVVGGELLTIRFADDQLQVTAQQSARSPTS
jgi:exodeoxyribonuclease VII large subunit